MAAFRHVPIFFLATAALFAASCSDKTLPQIPPPGSNATPPPTFAVTSFQNTQTADLAASTSLPPAGGYSGTLALGGTIQQYAQITQTVQDQLPAGLSPVTFGGAQVLMFYGLLFDAQMPSGSVGLTVTIPAASFIPHDRYFLALYDPQRPSLGWQQAFAGPASVSNMTVTFTSSYAFTRYVHYWAALYAIAPAGPAPTAAPSITPVPSPSPTPATIAAIQATMGPSFTCSGTPCATGDIPPPTQPPATYMITTGVTSPSLSGNATQLSLTPASTHESDVLYFTPKLVSAPLTTNAIWDFYFYIDQPIWSSPAAPATPGPTTMSALEFDFNMGMPNYLYNFSSQCVIRPTASGGPIWQIWGGGTDGWISSGFACNPADFTPNVWHHVTWVYRIHPDTLQTEYVSLTITTNGVTNTYTPPPNLTMHPVQPRKQATSYLEVQFQQDMHALDPLTSPPFNEWVDNVTLTYW